MGHRSAIAQLPTLRYRRMPAATLNETCNRNVLVKVLIESPVGIRNLPEIAAVPGIDLIGIGANDLSAELGVPGEYRHPRMLAAFDAAFEACRRAAKPLAIGGIADAAHVRELIDQGAVPFLMTGIDTEMMFGAAQERHRKALSILSIQA